MGFLWFWKKKKKNPRTGGSNKVKELPNTGIDCRPFGSREDRRSVPIGLPGYALKSLGLSSTLFPNHALFELHNYYPSHSPWSKSTYVLLITKHIGTGLITLPWYRATKWVIVLHSRHDWKWSQALIKQPWRTAGELTVGTKVEWSQVSTQGWHWKT